MKIGTSKNILTYNKNYYQKDNLKSRNRFNKTNGDENELLVFGKLILFGNLIKKQWDYLKSMMVTKKKVDLEFRWLKNGP